MHSVYVRLKILTEEGKKYADVEIPYERRRFSIADVEGRTIHSDGTSVPFTGKPYDKVLVKTATLRYQAKVFSMPDVQVGSILEYRYQLRYEDNVLLPPTWFMQGELYVRKAHYKYVPTPQFSNTVITTGRNQTATSLIWYPILPKGDAVNHYVPPTTGASGQLSDAYDLNVDTFRRSRVKNIFHRFTASRTACTFSTRRMTTRPSSGIRRANSGRSRQTSSLDRGQR